MRAELVFLSLLSSAFGLARPAAAQGDPWLAVATDANVYIMRDPTLMNVEADGHRYIGGDGIWAPRIPRPGLHPMWLLVEPGMRFVNHAEGSAPPPLDLGRTDLVAAGRPVDFWFSTAGVTPGDSMDVDIRIYPATKAGNTPLIELTSHLPTPLGGWGRATRVNVGALPPGRYVANILFTSEGYGMRARATQKVTVR